MKRAKTATARHYPRVARVNELLREIIGDELERIDADDLSLLTVTGVDCAPDLRHATVYFDGPDPAEDDERTIEALEAIRTRLQRAVASQARMKNTPELRFAPDPAVRAGEHIDDVLRAVARQTQAEPTSAQTDIEPESEDET